jgi:hypothetical protein
MVGRVIRQNRCTALAPSDVAACSWSVPASRSTGVTSRATSGSETNAVAAAIPSGA